MLVEMNNEQKDVKKTKMVWWDNEKGIKKNSVCRREKGKLSAKKRKRIFNKSFTVFQDEIMSVELTCLFGKEKRIQWKRKSKRRQKVNRKRS